jgi:hypothetical protein
MFALYINPETKQGFGFGCHSCNDGASQSQKEKIIRNMVRINSSLYTMNLATSHVYNNSNSVSNVNWNQMSDRNQAHVQQVVVSSRGSSTKRSVTRNRPGACSPGGAGVDVKHNSYDRHLARLKGKTCSKNMIASCNTTTSYDTVKTYVVFEFQVGDYVWALNDSLGPFFKAQITDIIDNYDNITIYFMDELGEPTDGPYTKRKDELLVYVCSC